MSQQTRLREALEDLTEDAPARVVTGDLAARSWRSARRRRHRRRLGGAVVMTAALAALALVVPDLRAAAPGGSAAGDAEPPTYPERITAGILGLPDGDVPHRPGPLAGVLFRFLEEDDFSSDDRYAVTAGGALTRLAPTLLKPVLSPDGRTLLTTSDDGDGLLLQDLVRATERVFHGVVVMEGSRVAWSGDGTRVLVRATVEDLDNQGPGAYVLNVDDGTAVRVPAPRTDGVRLLRPVGLDSHHDVVFLDRRPGEGNEVNMQVVDINGGRLRSVPLTGVDWRAPDLGLASISPDGTALVVPDHRGAGRATLRIFDLSNGRQTSVRSADGQFADCPLQWAGRDPVYSEVHADEVQERYWLDGFVAARPDGPERIVAVDPGLRASCVVWAAGALSGVPESSVLGANSAWWTWHWATLLLAMAGPVAWLTIRVRRRRRANRSRMHGR